MEKEKISSEVPILHRDSESLRDNTQFLMNPVRDSSDVTSEHNSMKVFLLSEISKRGEYLIHKFPNDRILEAFGRLNIGLLLGIGNLSRF